MVVLMLIDAGIFTTIGLPLRSCLTTFSALVIPSVFHVLRTITIYCGIEMIEFSLLVYQDHQFYQFMSNLIDSSLNKFEFTLIYGRLKRAMPFFLFLMRKKKERDVVNWPYPQHVRICAFQSCFAIVQLGAHDWCHIFFPTRKCY